MKIFKQILRLIISLSAAFYLISCGMSASKALEKGRYDYAIQKCVSKLLKAPNDAKYLDILSSSYTVAQLADKNEISALQLSSQDDRWDGIVNAYIRMANRSKTISILPATVKSQINFEYNTYAAEITDTKQKAADFNYKQGESFLRENDKFKARMAYEHFVKVQYYVGNNYKNLPQYLKDSHEKGLTKVLYVVNNRSVVPLDSKQLEYLYNIYPEQINSEWINYSTANRTVSKLDKVNLDPYDFLVILDISEVQFSPVFADSYSNNYTKKIENGTEYKVDGDGKPVLDSAGNFIVVKKYINAECQVLETRMSKTCNFISDLRFEDISNIGGYVSSYPLRQSTSISSSTYKLIGDNRALPADVQSKVAAAANMLPPDEEVLRQTCVDVSAKVKSEIYNNRRNIQ